MSSLRDNQQLNTGASNSVHRELLAISFFRCLQAFLLLALFIAHFHFVLYP